MIRVGEELPSLPPLTARHWFFIIQIFEQLSCSEKQSCPETFHCWNIFYLSGLLSSLWLALKTEFVMKLFAVFNIRFTFRMFEQLLLALKNSVPWIHCIECIFYPSEFWTTCACPEKQSLPWKCSLHWNKDFWVTCVCSENRVFPDIFHCIEIFLSLRIFEQLVLALKNRVCPEFTLMNIYFLSFRNLNNLRLPWKTESALEFFTILKYFLSFKNFEKLELALKTEFPLNFFHLGGRPPPPPPRTPLMLCWNPRNCWNVIG